MGSISRHITPLVINSLGVITHTHIHASTRMHAHTRTHTHTHTHKHTHTYRHPHRNNFKKPGAHRPVACTCLWPSHAWFNNHPHGKRLNTEILATHSNIRMEAVKFQRIDHHGYQQN